MPYVMALRFASASQRLGWGTLRPERTFDAADVDIPVALAMAGRVTLDKPGSTICLEPFRVEDLSSVFRFSCRRFGPLG